MEETRDLNSWHFYNYNTKMNFWGNILHKENAKLKFIDHYSRAREFYSTNQTESFRELGAAMHYISDIATPMHVGDGITPSSEWIELIEDLGIGVVFVLYLYDQYTKHTEFEDYVNARDQYAVCNIPTNIEYSYYANVELVVLVDIIASQSYLYYGRAQGNDSQKFEAMINTVPKAKEVVAGLLYRFAIEKSGQHVHDFKLIYTGNHYHSGDQHYYQYNNKCSTCGYIQNIIWKNYFCPGPPCVTPWSLDI